jgi:hypothetical protein
MGTVAYLFCGEGIFNFRAGALCAKLRNFRVQQQNLPPQQEEAR